MKNARLGVLSCKMIVPNHLWDMKERETCLFLASCMSCNTLMPSCEAADSHQTFKLNRISAGDSTEDCGWWFVCILSIKLPDNQTEQRMSNKEHLYSQLPTSCLCVFIMCYVVKGFVNKHLNFFLSCPAGDSLSLTLVSFFNDRNDLHDMKGVTWLIRKVIL